MQEINARQGHPQEEHIHRHTVVCCPGKDVYANAHSIQHVKMLNSTQLYLGLKYISFGTDVLIVMCYMFLIQKHHWLVEDKYRQRQSQQKCILANAFNWNFNIMKMIFSGKINGKVMHAALPCK